MEDQATPANSTLTLVSNDGTKFQLAASAIASNSSSFLASLLETAEDDGGNSGDEEIVLDRCGTETLERIVYFLQLCITDPMEAIQDPRDGALKTTFELNVPQVVYRKFMTELPRSVFWKVRSASNYLGIEQLVLLSNVWLAFELKGKSVTEIHEILGIPMMTEEEENQARRDHPWIFADPDADDNSNNNPQQEAT